MPTALKRALQRNTSIQNCVMSKRVDNVFALARRFDIKRAFNIYSQMQSWYCKRSPCDLALTRRRVPRIRKDRRRRRYTNRFSVFQFIRRRIINGKPFVAPLNKRECFIHARAHVGLYLFTYNDA